MKFMNIHEIEVHISDFRIILKNSDESMGSLICHHGTSTSNKYVFMVQVRSVFQGGAPDHKLEFRQRMTSFGEGALSKFV